MKKHSSHAQLLGIVEDDEYKPVPDHPPYSYQVGHKFEYPDHKQAANRHGGNRSAGQIPVPHDGYSYYEVDTDTRSHRMVDSVHQPSYTKCNPGATFKEPPPSHFTNVRRSPTLDHSMQSQAKYYTEHGPSGQPSRATLPAEPRHDIDESSLYDHQRDSLRSRYTSVSTPLKFDKLNEMEIPKVDSIHEVVVFGARNVGKTTIISCFLQDRYPNIAALDQQFKMHGVSVALSHKDSDKVLRLNIQEADNEITQEKINEYKRCQVAVVVYDVNIYDTLKKARCWITEIQKHIKEHSVEFILVGNKDDMIINNVDVVKKGMQLSIEMKMGHLLTCATNRLYMDKLLEDVATLAFNQQSDSVVSQLKGLKKDLESNLERQQLLEDTVKILKESLEESKRTIQRLEDRKCVIL